MLKILKIFMEALTEEVPRDRGTSLVSNKAGVENIDDALAKIDALRPSGAMDYPTFRDGVPLVAPSLLLINHNDAIALIMKWSKLSPSDFDELYLPTIERFVCYVHMIPASENHHHSGMMGLLLHSLDVTARALRYSQESLPKMNPNYGSQSVQLARWRYGLFIASLCHDIGKIVSDVHVTSSDGTEEWNPYSEPLFNWGERLGLERYFIRYVPDRGRQHEELGGFLVSKIAGPDGMNLMSAGGTRELMGEVLQSVRHSNPNALIQKIVTEADSASVAQHGRDTHSHENAAVPMAKLLLDSLRELTVMKRGGISVNSAGKSSLDD